MSRPDVLPSCGHRAHDVLLAWTGAVLFVGAIAVMAAAVTGFAVGVAVRAYTWSAGL